MSFRRALALAGYATLFALVWPAASPADHVSVEASVVAVLKERAGPGHWRVEVRYFVQCIGVTRGAVYSGNLNLHDEQTGERIYLGGVSHASGTVTQIVKAKPDWRRMRPELKISCGENLGGHGAGPIVVIGGVALIPPSTATATAAGAGAAPAGAIRRLRRERAAVSGHSWGRTAPTRSPGAAQEMSSSDAAGATAFTGATATIA